MMFENLPDAVNLLDIMDKVANSDTYMRYMLNRTSQMFEYSGLPDTIPQEILELYLQIYGTAFVTEHEGNLYVFKGHWGGERDVYYKPKSYIVANPWINVNKEFQIDVDGILVKNDTMWLGLLPLFSRYSQLLAENDISMKLATINLRNIVMISAPDDKTKKAGEKYLEDVTNGKQGIIAENAFLDGIRVQPLVTTGTGGSVTQLIELQQYLKAGWFNDLGLQANYNMKREAINTNEAQMDNDALLPLVDNMLKSRIENVQKINDMYGTNISVQLNSAWQERQEDKTEDNTEENPEDPKEDKPDESEKTD